MNTKYNYYCLDCSIEYISDRKANKKIRFDGREFEGTKCPFCGGNAKVIGTKLNFGVINGTSDSTRSSDLDILSDYADKGIGQSREVLDKVYKKSKDPELTRMRRELIDAHKKSDVPKSEVVEQKIRSYEGRTYGK